MNLLCSIKLFLVIIQISGADQVSRRRRVKFPKSTRSFFPISNRDSAVVNLDFDTLSSEVNKKPSADASSADQEKGSRRRKVKQKKRRVVHLEKTIIPFSKLAEIKGSLAQNRDLVTTIERGVRFIGALNSKVSASFRSQSKESDLSSSALEVDEIQDGVDFLKGSMKKLESQPFFEQLQREIFTFHSVPRNEREIQDFQRKVHERIKAFISLNELILVKPVVVKEGLHGADSRGQPEGFNVDVLSTSVASPMIR